MAIDRSGRPLPLDAWRTILARIRPYVHRLKLNGGESTLYPDLAELVALLDGRGMRFSVFTNACWTDPAEIVRLLGKNTALDGLLVSLHGATVQAHKRLNRVVGSFEETVANIRRAVSAGLPVALSTVIHRSNLDELEQMPVLCAGWGRITFLLTATWAYPIRRSNCCPMRCETLFCVSKRCASKANGSNWAQLCAAMLCRVFFCRLSGRRGLLHG